MSELSEAARKMKNDYQREWRKKNPGKNSEACRRYWERRAAKQAEKGKA